MNDSSVVMLRGINLVCLYLLPAMGIRWMRRSPSRFALVRGGATGGLFGGILMVLFLQLTTPELQWLNIRSGLSTVVWGAVIGLIVTGIRALIRRLRAGRPASSLSNGH